MVFLMFLRSADVLGTWLSARLITGTLGGSDVLLSGIAFLKADDTQPVGGHVMGDILQSYIVL